MPDKARKWLDEYDEWGGTKELDVPVSHLRRLLATNERLESVIAEMDDYIPYKVAEQLDKLKAANERLEDAMNKALDLDSRSHTREGWKRDIVQAMQILRDALSDELKREIENGN